MWKCDLGKRYKPKTATEIESVLWKHFEGQFDRLTPQERWTAVSLLENKRFLRNIVRDNNVVEEQSEEQFDEQSEEQFEDTIYNCEDCGSKKIDICQKSATFVP